jgi:hypothetical protein
LKYTNVSEVLKAFIIRAIMMEAVFYTPRRENLKPHKIFSIDNHFRELAIAIPISVANYV